MRKLIEARIIEITNGNDDALLDLDCAGPYTHDDLPNLTDQELLNVFEGLISFNG